MEKLTNDGVGAAFHRFRRSYGQNPDFVDDGNTVGNAKSEVAIVRHHK
jgi:hypothetical protein